MVQQVGTPRNKVIPQPTVKRRVQKFTIKDLLRQAVKYQDKDNAEWVHVSRIETLRDKQGRVVLRGNSVTTKPNTPPDRGHLCSFRPADPAYKGKLFNCDAVMADCNCHRWMFVWEYALWYRGAAALLRSNGEYPEQTNPTLKIGLCKHLIKLGAKIVSERR
jgi:hypothetical protein